MLQTAEGRPLGPVAPEHWHGCPVADLQHQSASGPDCSPHRCHLLGKASDSPGLLITHRQATDRRRSLRGKGVQPGRGRVSALLAADGTLHSLLQVARLKGMPEPDVLHPAQAAARLVETTVLHCPRYQGQPACRSPRSQVPHMQRYMALRVIMLARGTYLVHGCQSCGRWSGQQQRPCPAPQKVAWE